MGITTALLSYLETRNRCSRIASNPYSGSLSFLLHPATVTEIRAILTLQIFQGQKKAPHTFGSYFPRLLPEEGLEITSVPAAKLLT